MKTICILGILSLLPNLNAQTATPPPGAGVTPARYFIGEQGANHRTWMKATTTPDGQGNTVTTTNVAYVELASGLNYWDATSNAWEPSKELIEQYPGGAIARYGQHKVIFANNLNTSVAIDMQTPDGKRLQSHIVGLGYYDTASGQSVLIAQVKDCAGVIVGNNQVIYPDAFTDFKAAVIYKYTWAGLEQDIVLLQRPPLPEVYGLSSATTKLQVLTEFLNPPEPKIIPVTFRSALGKVQDEALNFGTMRTGHGRAFKMGAAEKSLEGTTIDKQWLLLNGRHILVEEVPIPAVAKQLDTLPLTAQMNVKRVPGSPLHVISSERLLPEPVLAKADKREMRMAKTSGTATGLVMDYVLLNVNTNDYTFRGDTTYFVSGQVSISGQMTLEGGAVIKIAPTNSANLVSDGGDINCQTGPYRPCILTSSDDNTVGQTIPGSTGAPTNLYLAGITVFTGTSPTIKNLKICYGNYGLSIYTSADTAISDVQFLKCSVVLDFHYNTGRVRNCLMSQVNTPFFGAGFTFGVENTTIDTAYQLSASWNGPGDGSLYFTNCIVVGVSNTWKTGLIVTNHTILNTNAMPELFQTVGGGGHYLADDSPCRDAGTSNINPDLLAELQKETTYPPLLYSNQTVTVNTTLSPQAQRDTDTPDVGYHYDPIDYITCVYAVTNNAVLTVTNGAVIAGDDSAGIWLQDGSSIVSVGLPQTPNWFVRYQAVQEQPVTLGGYPPADGWPVDPYHFTNAAPTGYFQFTKFACPAGGGYHLYHTDLDPYYFGRLTVKDCEFWSGQNDFSGFSNTVCTLDNNLFARSTLSAVNPFPSSYLYFTNNLVWGTASVKIRSGNGAQPWYAYNNAFDNTTFTGIVSSTNWYNGYNAYLNCTNYLYPTNATDLFLTNSLAYEMGPLGDFYQPTNSPLIDMGSTNANLLGLYHFTTTTNELKEANSTVDIGYHYVALDANGNPIDTDGDGVPDYLEDADGNGTVDSGETDWQSATDLGLKVIITRPHNGSLLP